MLRRLMPGQMLEVLTHSQLSRSAYFFPGGSSTAPVSLDHDSLLLHAVHRLHYLLAFVLEQRSSGKGPLPLLSASIKRKQSGAGASVE